uniref:Uncharacterized protein n=1 Tax=Salix viminalis TaxID=40686 RepID=A0A6N2LRS6_SALVM
MATREGVESSGTGIAAAAAAGAVAGAAPVGSTSDSGKTKTMKAPGRNVRISRESFERDPKGYFRDMINRRKEERAGKFRE